MANSLKQDILGRFVVIKQHRVTGTTSDVLSRIMRCEGGPGCYIAVTETSIRGQFPANRVVTGEVVINGKEDIERFADEREIQLAID